VARTVKGKGVSFMEGIPHWHARVPTPEELETALREIG
jgi:transketolase